MQDFNRECLAISIDSSGAAMIREQRTWEIFENNTAAFRARFRDCAARMIQSKYGFKIVAMWRRVLGPSRRPPGPLPASLLSSVDLDQRKQRGALLASVELRTARAISFLRRMVGTGFPEIWLADQAIEQRRLLARRPTRPE
jgi:hypothetical protein